MSTWKPLAFAHRVVTVFGWLTPPALKPKPMHGLAILDLCRIQPVSTQ
jgi:hypothetical protein